MTVWQQVATAAFVLAASSTTAALALAALISESRRTKEER